MIHDGAFRQDLWYRLQVITLELPPLRERPGDVILLAEHFLRQLGNFRLSQHAVRTLLTHDWPGNIRELRNTISRAAAQSQGTLIDERHLELGTATSKTHNHCSIPWNGTLAEAVVIVEREMIRHALAETGGNRAEAARRLGLHRQQLYRKLDKLDLSND